MNSVVPSHAFQFALRALAAAAIFVAPAVEAQPNDGSAPTITARWPADRFIGGRSPLELELSRPLASDERLAILIGTLDVSSLLEVRGTRVRYRPIATRLTSGENELVAYRVNESGEWAEIGRAPLRVLTRAGLESGGIIGSADLSSSGQIDQRLPVGSPPPDRRAYQDFTLNLALQGNAARNGWSVTTQANAIAVTEELQRLRYAQMQDDAPALDLSDYRVAIANGATNLTLGNVSAGTNRLLLNGFGSRGLAGSATLAPFATLDAAVMNGSSVVGWTNMLGMAEPNHRVGTASLNLELVPSRPGAFHLDVTGLDASLLPLTSFNQGAANDAEQSRGVGVQVAMSDAGQRLRFSAGLSRSRFVNPFDPALAGDTTVVPVRPTTRTARYGELGLQLLQNLRVTESAYASLGATLRHERTDPLYRSIGAFVQPDVETNGVDVTGSLGSVSLQGSYSGARDNLAEIASILTTRTRSRGLSASLPTASLVKASAWYWPQLTWSLRQIRQFGEGIPVNGDFSASHVPDQRSTDHSVALTWSRNASTLTYRWNRSFQDNRQTGREQADFGTRIHGISLGLTPVSRLMVNIDASHERQKTYESLTTQQLQRLGGSVQWQVTGSTSVSGALSVSRTRDPLSRMTTHNTEHQLELSQGFNLYRRVETGTQGRLFIRYGRTRAAMNPFDAVGQPPAIMWTLSAGSSFRLY